jgi:hypothetical protein
MTDRAEKAGLLEAINQPGELWFATAIAQFKFVNGCCEQVSGCCQRVSRQLSLDDLFKELTKKTTG